MTVVVAVLAALCVGVFVWLVPAGGFLVAGLVLLWVALVRRENERRRERR